MCERETEREEKILDQMDHQFPHSLTQDMFIEIPLRIECTEIVLDLEKSMWFWRDTVL